MLFLLLRRMPNHSDLKYYISGGLFERYTADLVIFAMFYFLRIMRGGQIREIKNLEKIIFMIRLLKQKKIREF